MDPGKLSISRLEKEIEHPETDRAALQQNYDDFQQKVNEAAIRDSNVEVLQRTLRDFESTFAALGSAEQSEALQCVLK